VKDKRVLHTHDPKARALLASLKDK
jgi:hypothetical protein